MAGVIAGVVMGLGGHFSSWLGAIMGLWEPVAAPPIVQLLGLLGFDVVWGIILAILYSVLYNSIPGKGVSKGLVYGLIIYLVSNIRAANLLWSFGNSVWALIFAFTGIFAPILGGLVLGALYKK